jgi:hypothetical protein
VSDPISSEGWTGDLEANAAERRFAARTHRLGEPVYVSDFDRIADGERLANAVPMELRGLLRLAVFALLSPLFLFCAWLAVQMTTREAIGQDNRAYLMAWGFAVAALALTQMVSRSKLLIRPRKALMALTIAATLIVSGGYVFLASRSKAKALGSRPERAFELYRSVGSRSFRRTEVTHQRADGTLLEGGYTPPVHWAHVCTLAQRLTGDHGFTWVKVLERSRSRQRGELYWPIRREECFSDTPLELLPR